MSRKLIDRDALIASIPKTNVDIFENCRNCSTLCDWQVRELIEQAELVDAVEVVHGEWIEADDLEGAIKGIVVCSNCKNLFQSIVMTNEKIILTNQKTKYCPNCGAKMRGERSE